MTEKPRRSKAPSKGGRPPYKATIAARQRVEEMKFCGESDACIARALGIDPDTLRKHFEDELADGHAQRRSEVIGLMFDAARKGNVSAMKRLDEMGRAPAPGASEDRGGRVAASMPREGKKAEQQRVAEGVTGKFAPPPQPKLVVSNG